MSGQMTNKEAIEKLEIELQCSKIAGNWEQVPAIEKGIDALKAHEHDGCDWCKYGGKAFNEMPCVLCMQNYRDLWERRDDGEAD